MPFCSSPLFSWLFVGVAFVSGPDAPEVVVVEHAVSAAIPKAASEAVFTESANATEARPVVDRHLSVQVTLRDARERLQAGDAAEAVRRLEERLPDAVGAADYLDVLASAYRRELGRLVRENKTVEAAAVERRLRMLGQPAEPKPLPAPTPPSKPKTHGLLGANLLQGMFGGKSATSEPSAPKIARAKWDRRAEIDANGTENHAHDDLAKADECWAARDFAKALSFYEAAYRTDPAGKVQEARDRFGYCLLVVAFEKFASASADDDACLEAWETNVRQGRDLVRIASYRKFADDQLAMLAERRAQARRPRDVETTSASAGQPRGKPEAATTASYRHLSQEFAGGWRITETDNFRIVHRDVALAEEVAAIAETARRQAHEMWFPAEPLAKWTPKCDLVLYPTAQEFAQQTNQMPQSPAFTQCEVSNGWVGSRRIELRADEPKMKSAILPHEIAHAVFAGKFAGQSPPKWADEGMAVLTEPAAIQDMHLGNLVRSRSSGRGFSCQRLLTLKSYPPEVQDFYAHSVGVCRLLVEQHGGREKLVQYVRLAVEINDPDTALFRVYGIRGLANLESLFNQFVVDSRSSTTAAN